MALTVAVPLLVAACGQGNSDNVMAPSGNALPPGLVDLALGPEPGNAPANELEPVNDVAPVEPVEPAVAAPSDNRVDAAPTDNAAEEAPDVPVDEQPTENE